MLLLLLILFVVVCLILIISPFILVYLKSSRTSEEYGNCLLVIAHPDDECLFFSPILLSLRSSISILCLSNGNNHRSEEFIRSCQQLHIKQYKIIDDQIHLKDSQKVFWSSDAILGHVKQAIDRWQISTIISFDSYGISGHKNHSSIYYALLKLSDETSRLVHFLSLQSIPIYRKYLTLFELFRLNSKERVFILPREHLLTPHRAMFEHRSQLVWFRYLYVLFSRYIFINDFKLIY